MAYDEKLADRVRAILHGHPGLDEKKMFGGLCFPISGNMACGITVDTLMVRVGKEAYEACLARSHARPMDFTGKPLTGMVYVAAPGLATKRQLAAWVKRGTDFAGSLPVK